VATPIETTSALAATDTAPTALVLDITVPLRHFALETALEIGVETMALVGPSGAGKTTVLRAISGLATPSRGVITLGDHVWFSSEERTNLSPDLRSVGLVFQDYALFPHMTVRQNIEYGRAGRSAELMERFRISHLAHAKPDQLSGGERQRVAVARAIAREPGVLLLDEPLAALDAHTKQTVRGELRELLAEAALPTLIVTHDFEDAASLAGRIGVIVDGRLRQDARPEELVAAPADEFVAHLTGANVPQGRAAAAADGLTAVTLDDGTRIFSTDAAVGPVSVAIYPWEVSLGRTEPDESALNHLRGAVRSAVTIGNRVRVRVGPVTAEVTLPSAERIGVAEGELLVASFKATATRLISTSRA
jgi:ABC-type sulfate/molybdate transport systems ATPase subunit